MSWSKTSRDAAIWSYIEEKSSCGGCGTKREEWLDEDGKIVRQEDEPYEPEVKICGGCRRMDIFQKELAKEFEKTPAAMRGAKFGFKKKEKSGDANGE